MNKEKVEKAIKILLKEDRFYDDETEIKATKVLLKYIKELEQKESILDKVTDKLKEDIKIFGNHEERKQMCKEQLYENDGKWFHAKEILNIIEGEKKRAEQ